MKLHFGQNTLGQSTRDPKITDKMYLTVMDTVLVLNGTRKQYNGSFIKIHLTLFIDRKFWQVKIFQMYVRNHDRYLCPFKS
jgi:hypothetical protein